MQTKSEWDIKLEKEDEFRTKRHTKRTNIDFAKKNCCAESDVKLIFAHGHVDPKQNFELLEGYNVILLSTYGKEICVNLKFVKKLKQIYKEGKSIFENNDKNPFQYTSEGIQLSDLLKSTSDFRLFIGGEQKVGGVNIQPYIPNIKLEFGGSNCDNWGGQTDPAKIDYGCYIQCIDKENPAIDDDTAQCEKYFFSNDFDPVSSYDNDHNKLNKQGIYLQDLLLAEGKGTYILLSCLSYNRELTIDEKERYYSMVNTVRSLQGSPAHRTRNKRKRMEYAQEEHKNRYAKGIKTRKKKKSKNSKKHRKSMRKKRGKSNFDYL